MNGYSLLYKAKELLNKEFEDNLRIVSSSSFHKAFVYEKIKHSFQVAGAGNGILAHEAYFKDKSEAFIDVCKTAILLHDVYRFCEIRTHFETGKKVDHGLKGAEFLEHIDEFNNPLITLPIKHHGHMIECLYEDKAFLSLDEKTKEDVKHISFAVRDADKIANWYLLSREWMNMKELWFPGIKDCSKANREVSSEIWDYFLAWKVMPNNLRKTTADYAFSILGWLFDIQYVYSISYCQKLDLFKRFCSILEGLKIDKAKINEAYRIMEAYVLSAFKIKI